MRMTFYYKKHNLSKCNVSRVVFLIYSMYLNFNGPSLYFLVFHKNGLIKSCLSFNPLTHFYQSMTLHFVFVDFV
jgi:hypothetical protein